MSIGVYQTLAPYVLPLILKEFARAHPLVEISFIETQQAGLMSALTSGSIDVVFSYPHEVPAEVAHRVILERSPHVLLPADHRLAGRESLSLWDIADEPLILLGDAPSKAITLRVLGISSQDPRIRWETSSRSLARALVGAGLGVTTLVQPDASPWTIDGLPLVEVPLLVSVPDVHVHVAWLKPAEGQRSPRRVSELVTFMHEHFPQHIQRIDERRSRTAAQR
jgi:DNA-binding transcriptional LysR family regulator